MSTFKVTRKTVTDLIAIGQFTQKEWGRAQRNIYLKQLDSCFKQLAKNPELGASCDYIKDGYRKFPQGSHLVFYRQDSEGTLEIIRVLHKNMDVESKFDDA